MRPRRPLLVIAGAILALAAFAPAASASSPIGAVHLEKHCYGATCIVTWVGDGPIPVGTVGTYLGPVSANRTTRVVVLDAGDGTATGLCTVNYASLTGSCTFAQGTGSLAGVHVKVWVSVTFEDENDWTWHWDGTYHWD